MTVPQRALLLATDKHALNVLFSGTFPSGGLTGTLRTYCIL